MIVWVMAYHENSQYGCYKRPDGSCSISSRQPAAAFEKEEEETEMSASQ